MPDREYDWIINRPPPGVPDYSTSSLEWMAREGHQVFSPVTDMTGFFTDSEWFLGPLIGWPWEDAENAWTSEDAENLTTPAMFRRLRLLRANAVLEVAPTPAETRKATEASLGTQAVLPPDERDELNPKLEALWRMDVRRDQALQTLWSAGWEWDEQDRLAKRPSTGGRRRELLTDVVGELALAWHEGGKHQAPAKLVERICHGLRWYFRPELLERPPTVAQAIRNYRKRTAGAGSHQTVAQ